MSAAGTAWWFVRHGESVANAGGWLSGWDDVPLTQRGEAEARARADAVAALPIRRCLTSDLQRARATAVGLLAHRPDVPIHVDAGLRERNLGVFQGRPLAEAGEPEARRLLRSWRVAPPGGESHEELVARALATLRRWDDGSPTLVVAHGALIRDLLGVLDGRAPDDFLQDAATANVALHPRVAELATLRPRV